MNSDYLIELYCQGDRFGAPFESAGNAPVSFSDMMANRDRFPTGTDESDLVHNFIRFTKQYQWRGDGKHFAVEWAKFITANHRHTSYGKTWRELFALVRFLRKNRKDITFEGLSRIAKDVDSCGNGILALAYPAWRYSKVVDADPFNLIHDLAAVSHANDLAKICLSSLIWHFSTRGKTRPPAELILADFPEANYRMVTHLAPGCLLAAFECAQGKKLEDVLETACQIGGDMDSYLSLALLLWGFKR